MMIRRRILLFFRFVARNIAIVLIQESSFMRYFYKIINLKSFRSFFYFINDNNIYHLTLYSLEILSETLKNLLLNVL